MRKKTTNTTSTGGTLKRTLNRDEKNELFAKYAVFIHQGGDVFPVNVAVKLLGADAVRYANDDIMGNYHTWHFRNGSYLDREGFGRAVTVHNASLYGADDAVGGAQ